MALNTGHLIVIGGTSGIGLALAKRHLRQGWQVTIIGSSSDKITHLSQQYHDNTNVTLLNIDIAQAHDRQALYRYLNATPFNRLIYAAGIYFNERKLSLSADDSEQMLMVNLQAFGEIFYQASECLKKSQKTHPDTQYHMIAISSVAGLLTFKNASLYAKCKAAMISICQAYRAGLMPFNIGVTCIASGYVDTKKLRQLNGGTADHKPFLCSTAQAVDEIEHAILHNKALHVFPKPMKYLVCVLSALPTPVLDKIMALQYRHQDKQTT